jgi:Fungal specific transcription factor domain
VSALRRNPRDPDHAPCFGFIDLPIETDFEDILWDMRTYIDLMELHCDGLFVNPEPARLATYRNLIQYRLLSLKWNTKNTRLSICRLAALIFSFGVIYPLADPDPLQQLCDDLQKLLERTPEIADDFIIWATMLGGIAALGTDRQDWFVQRLVAACRKRELRTWKSVKSGMRTFLWSERACDPGGLELWLQIVEAQCQIS